MPRGAPTWIWSRSCLELAPLESNGLYERNLGWMDLVRILYVETEQEALQSGSVALV